MEPRIGEVLREARRRREIDLAEVEEATRIRPRYLRAIEDEEWDVLPGGVYTRGFIRTYGAFLGLDGDRLAEDYRERVEGASREWTPLQEVAQASGPASVRPPGGRRSVPAAGWLAALAIAALAIVLLPTGGGGGGAETESPNAASRPARDHLAKREQATTPSGVSVRLAASAEVWVCVLDADGRRLVNGQILEEGTEAGPFRSDRFTVSFGNGEVSMLIDGKEAEIPPTSSPIGYSIDASGELVELAESERPTCT
jgi:cytoskeleton protein RodZ